MYDNYKYYGYWNAYSDSIPEYPTAEDLGNYSGLVLTINRINGMYYMFEGPLVQVSVANEQYIMSDTVVYTESMR